MLVIDPFKLYIGAGICTGKWFPNKMGERILLGVDSETSRVKVGFFYPSFEDSHVNETHMVPMEDCRLILRSIDDDITTDELRELEAMGFGLSKPRHYIRDAVGDTPIWRLEQVALLTIWLISKHFSVGVIPKSQYTIKNDQRAA